MEINEKNNTFTRSFRVTEEFVEKFQILQKELGLTQDKALAMLIKTYELETSKTAIPERETEINNFQSKITEITEAYLYSLQINQDAEARIRGDYAIRMDNQDKIIFDYQQQLKEMKTTINELTETNQTLSATAQNFEMHLQKAIESENKTQKTIKDKEEINTMLTEKLKEIEHKITEYDSIKKENKKLNNQLSLLQQEFKDIQKEHENREEKLLMQLEQNKKDCNTENDKKLVAMEQQQKDAIQELRRKYEKELADRELENEKQLSAKDRYWIAEIAKIEKEQSQEIKELYQRIATLQEEKATLFAQQYSSQENNSKKNKK